MGFYAYICDKCSCEHEEFKRMTAPHPRSCPNCGAKYGKGFRQDYSQHRITGYVSDDPKTFGQQAELNAKRMGKEQMQLHEEAERAKRSGCHVPLADGTFVKAAEPVKPVQPWWRNGSVEGLKKLEKPLDITKIKDTEKYVQTGDAE